MKDIFTTVWGKTKLTRTALALVFAVGSTVAMLNEVNVPEWYVGIASASILSYFVTRGSEGSGA